MINDKIIVVLDFATQITHFGQIIVIYWHK